MLICVKYNGMRFPRTVSLQGGKKVAFHKCRLFLNLKEYDALNLLKLNNRLQPKKWEFTIDSVIRAEKVIKPQGEIKENIKKNQPEIKKNIKR